MKITKSQLRHIIREELVKLNESEASVDVRYPINNKLTDDVIAKQISLTKKYNAKLADDWGSDRLAGHTYTFKTEKQMKDWIKEFKRLIPTMKVNGMWVGGEKI